MKFPPGGPIRVIGLLGGVASGKSTIAAEFERLGCRVIDADRIAHQALDDPAVRRALEQRFGRTPFAPDGSIDRTRLGKLVFDDPAALEFLNGLLHPRVRTEIAGRLAEFRSAGEGWVVLDVALLHESGLATLCDRLVFVESEAAERGRRARVRGWGTGEVARREARQAPLEEKRRIADHIIENRGPLATVRERVKALFDTLQR